MIYSLARILLSLYALVVSAWVNIYLAALPFSLPLVHSWLGLGDSDLFRYAAALFSPAEFGRWYADLCTYNYCFPSQVEAAYRVTVPSMAIAAILTAGLLSVLLAKNSLVTRKRITKIITSNGVAARYLCSFKGDGQLLYDGDLSQNHELVSGLAEWLRAKPVPIPANAVIHVLDSNVINAFALTTLTNKPHIVITTAVLQQLNHQHFSFLMLHELGHIKKLHSLSTLILNQTMNVIQWSWRCTALLGRVFDRFYRRFYRAPFSLLRLVSAFFGLFLLVLRGFNAVNWVFIKSLLVIDKAISRRMEFQADHHAVAVQPELAAAGIELLTGLKSSFDWLPNISSTHPSMKSRINRIKSIN